jgi:hypothetical protein
MSSYKFKLIINAIFLFDGASLCLLPSKRVALCLSLYPHTVFFQFLNLRVYIIESKFPLITFYLS